MAQARPAPFSASNVVCLGNKPVKIYIQILQIQFHYTLQPRWDVATSSLSSLARTGHMVSLKQKGARRLAVMTPTLPVSFWSKSPSQGDPHLLLHFISQSPTLVPGVPDSPLSHFFF